MQLAHYVVTSANDDIAGLIMGAQLRVVEDPLFAGFYSVPQAARLLGMSNRTQKLRGWINGYRGADPIILRDFEDQATISFLDMMEMRFLEYFRAQGVSMQTLRKAATRARAEWGTKHPFALSSARYLTDRKNIIAAVAKDSGDEETYDMATGQHEMWDVIEQVIERDVVFDPKTHFASGWYPLPEFRGVVVDPRRAFGKPVVAEIGIPTSALFRQWRAEGSFERVAKWFKIEPEAVKMAVQFEVALAA